MSDSAADSPQQFSNAPSVGSVASLVTYGDEEEEEEEEEDATKKIDAQGEPVRVESSQADAAASAVLSVLSTSQDTVLDEEDEEHGLSPEGAAARRPVDPEDKQMQISDEDEEESALQRRRQLNESTAAAVPRSRRPASGGGSALSKKARLAAASSLVSYGYGDEEEELAEDDDEEQSEDDEEARDDERMDVDDADADAASRRRRHRSRSESAPVEDGADAAAEEGAGAGDAPGGGIAFDREQIASFLRELGRLRPEEIRLPPLPRVGVAEEEQRALDDMLERKKRFQNDVTFLIKTNKAMRNPSIYEKLVETVGLDERGTNFPAEVFDPHRWGKDAFYEELSKSQRVEMERLEKLRKDRLAAAASSNAGGVASASGAGAGLLSRAAVLASGSAAAAATAAAVALGASGGEVRRSKWDAGPAAVAQRLPVVTHATGTKTAIPAAGSLFKKKH